MEAFSEDKGKSKAMSSAPSYERFSKRFLKQLREMDQLAKSSNRARSSRHRSGPPKKIVEALLSSGRPPLAYEFHPRGASRLQFNLLI